MMALPSVEELLTEFGGQLRAERIRQRLDQAALAARAGVERKTISRLEQGTGGTVHTLVAVLRALGRLEWLKSFAPAVAVDPMQLLRSSRRVPQRVKRSKEERGDES